MHPADNGSDDRAAAVGDYGAKPSISNPAFHHRTWAIRARRADGKHRWQRKSDRRGQPVNRQDGHHVGRQRHDARNDACEESGAGMAEGKRFLFPQFLCCEDVLVRSDREIVAAAG